MKKVMIIVMILILTLAMTATVSAGDQNRIHLIVFAQDAKTEIEVKAGDNKKKTALVDAGVTYLSYKTKTSDLLVWEYGEKVKPRVDKGRDGEWYSIICITPPGESIGEK